jgi:hypothetical protein
MICLNNFALVAIIVETIFYTLLLIKLDEFRREQCSKYSELILKIKKDKDEEIAGLTKYFSRTNQKDV